MLVGLEVWRHACLPVCVSVCMYVHCCVSVWLRVCKGVCVWSLDIHACRFAGPVGLWACGPLGLCVTERVCLVVWRHCCVEALLCGCPVLVVCLLCVCVCMCVV